MAVNEGYRSEFKIPDDTAITTRGDIGRWLVLIGSAVLMFGLPIYLFHSWGSLLDFPRAGTLVGVVAGGFIASKLIPNRFLIYNSEWTAFVTQNMFGGNMVAYGPGLHPSYPWEGHSQAGNYPLSVVTSRIPVSLSTTTSKLDVTIEYQYAISLPDITVAIGIDESTMREGIIAFVQSFMVAECAKKTAEEIRAEIGPLNNKLALHFTGSADTFRKSYGFVTVSLLISNIAFPDAAQKTRNAIDEATNLFKVMAELRGIKPPELAELVKKGGIPPKDYQNLLNRAMAVSDNATMDIKVIEGDLPAAMANILSGESKRGGR